MLYTLQAVLSSDTSPGTHFIYNLTQHTNHTSVQKHATRSHKIAGW